MQCERLIKLSKSWYISVKEETMAPARMVQFIKQHVASCSVCEEDPDIQDEIVKITEIVLPESKIPKAVRMKQQELEEAENADEEESEEDSEDTAKTDDTTYVEDEETEEPLSQEEKDL
jgi:hypothetical protein